MIQFGQKENGVDYINRPGAYAVISEKNKIALVKIEVGFFLPGGGVELGEDFEVSLKREILEEIGYDSVVLDKIGEACQFLYSPSKKMYLNKVEHFYITELAQYLNVQSEDGHKLVWVAKDEAVELLYEEAQRWAVKQLDIC